MIKNRIRVLISVLTIGVSCVKIAQEALARGSYLGFQCCYWKKAAVLWGKVKVNICNLGFH